MALMEIFCYFPLRIGGESRLSRSASESRELGGSAENGLKGAGYVVWEDSFGLNVVTFRKRR